MASAGNGGNRQAIESAANRVANVLRDRVLSGELQPGERLSEEHVREDLGSSRGTLREAFQLLIRERLLVHQLSRGVFVRELSRRDVSDLYHARRVVECAALASVKTLNPAHLMLISQALEDGRNAANVHDWQQVASASVRFHEALVGLADSKRLSIFIAGLLAEFRLAYARMDDTATFHEAFLDRNEALANRIRSGDLPGAVAMLEAYLRDSEQALLTHYDAT